MDIKHSIQSPRRSITLALPMAATAHWHDVHCGVAEYAASRGWFLATDVDGTASSFRDYLATACDGLIAAVTTSAEARVARSVGVPVVNVSGGVAKTGLPTVTFDNAAIGRLAAAHLLDRGYEHFAFYGLAGVAYSALRQRAFVESLAAMNIECAVLEVPASWLAGGPAAAHVDALEAWLGSLPERTGLFAVTDPRAVTVLEACGRLGIDVPHRLGVLGVGDFEPLCEFTSPPLSSIRRNGRRVGIEACRLLERLMADERRAAGTAADVVPPNGVTPRGSTDGDDPDAYRVVAARAAEFMRSHVGERFGVDRVLRELRLSRRKLERAFERVFGESPALRLLRVRAEVAAAALKSRPDDPLSRAAEAAGFRDVRHMRHTFIRLSIPLTVARKRARK